MLRSFFISLSTNKPFRKFSESSSLGRRVSHRFVAGMTIEEAIAAAQQLNREGIAVTLDALGESVTDEPHANASAATYHRLLDEIATHNLNANVSLKLTQMGMDVGHESSATEGPALAERIVADLVAHAARYNNFVRIDMEGSEYTEATLDMTDASTRASPAPSAPSSRPTCSAPKPTSTDCSARASASVSAKAPTRSPPTSPSPTSPTSTTTTCGRQEADPQRRLLRHRDARRGHRRRPLPLRKVHRIEKSAFEFQMLYGIRRDLQRKLVAKGYSVRVYVPFGTEWYPYFMRRLAERPANVLFLAKNFFRS